jgi:hypothetical protein
MLENKLELILFFFFLTNSVIQSIPKCCWNVKKF